MELRQTDPVSIKNNSDIELTCKWQGNKYVLRPKSEQHWPWAAACQLLGNPTLQNTPRDAAADNVRLECWKMLYPQLTGGNLTLELKPKEQAELLPDIEVALMDGTPVKMALQTDYVSEDFTEGYTNDDMAVRVAQLEAQLSQYKENMVAEGQPFIATESSPTDDSAPSSAEELPTDEGPKTAPRRRQPAKSKSSSS